MFAGFGAAAIAAYFGGSFAVPFYISAVLCAIASLCSLFVLRPLVRRRIATEVSAARAEGIALSAALAQRPNRKGKNRGEASNRRRINCNADSNSRVKRRSLMPVDTLIAPEEELTFVKKPPKISEPNSRPAAEEAGPKFAGRDLCRTRRISRLTPD